MMKRFGWILAILLTIALAPMNTFAHEQGAPPAAASGEGEMTKGHGHGMMHSKKMQECMAMKEQAKADMNAMDERLEAKVNAMNTAKGEARSEAMAAVINELVEQRKEMRSNLTKIHHAKRCAGMRSMGHGGMHKGHHMEEHHGSHAGHGGDTKSEGASQ